MSHIFEAIGCERELREKTGTLKFVTIQDAVGTFKTRIHDILQDTSHLQHLANLLESAGIGENNNGSVKKRVEQYKKHCMGGGIIDWKEKSIVWESASIYGVLDREEPEDKTLSSRLLEEINTFVKQYE